MNVEPKCYSGYLLNSLRGEAKTKLKSSVSVSTSYKTIWDCLDIIYDSDWTVANATIESLLQLHHPCPNVKEVVNTTLKIYSSQKNLS